MALPVILNTQDDSMVKYIKSVLMRYRYHILVAVTMLMAVEIWVTFEGLVPIEHESVTAWVLCTTILVWVGMVGLIGVVAPVYYPVMKYLYVPLAISIIFIFELVIFALIVSLVSLIPVAVIFSLVAVLVWYSVFWMRRSDMSWIRKWIASVGRKAILILVVSHSIMVMLWIVDKFFLELSTLPGLNSLLQYLLLVVVGMASMIAIVARAERTPIGYSLVVIFPLLLFAWVGLSSMFLTATPSLQYWFVAVFFLLMAIALIASLVLWLKTTETLPNLLLSYFVVFGVGLTLLGSFVVSSFNFGLFLMLLPAVPLLLLLSLRVTTLLNQIGHPYRNVVATTIALCAMTAVTGWYWGDRLPNGLDVFTGQERIAAKDALSEAHCEDAVANPSYLRVVKDESGEFRVLGYTWWGFPSRAPSCGTYRQGNRW